MRRDETASDRRSPVRTPELDAAHQRVVEAYRLVRQEVFDRHPGQVPRADELAAAERDLVEQLRQAEEALDDLRRRWHTTT